MTQTPDFPKCYKNETKPSNFCPGCGHSLVLKTLGNIIDKFGIQKKSVFGVDIGCSLLAWDFFDVDTVQTHHGRVTPVMSGIKFGNPKATCIAYMGDGGGYAIGFQSLLHAALRNDNITVILVNNTLYAMTGGQKAPTTLPKEITNSSPEGKFILEEPLYGPELISQMTKGRAYTARGSVENPHTLKKYIENALLYQINGKGFSFVEILSYCPINWKTDAKGEIGFLRDHMEKNFPVGEITYNK